MSRRETYMHEVLIAPSVGRARWRPCVIVAERPRTQWLPQYPVAAPGLDVRTADGVLWPMCHRDCVRPRRGRS